MNNRQLIAILIVSMVFATILGYFFAIVTIPITTIPSIPTRIPDPEIIATFTILKTIVSFINMALILITLGIYLDIYRTIKSKFTLGLVTMILLLLMYALTSNPLFHFRFGYETIGLGPFTILPDIFTTVALLILFYISLE